MKLRELGEDRLVAQLISRLKTAPGVIAGPGDDCAVVAPPEKGRLLLLKTDCVVESVHFLPNEKAQKVGWKAMMRTLSDFAAMAGEPHYALVTLITPAEREARWMTQLYQGLQRAADRFGVVVVGGETSGTPGPTVISVSALGSVEKAALCPAERRQGRRRSFRDRETRWFRAGAAPEFHPPDCGSALVVCQLSVARDDGPERWPGRRSATPGRSERGRL